MTVSETRKALMTAARAYDRAARATTCAIATTNLRLGQQWESRGHQGVREHIPAKTEWRHYSPVQRELSEIEGSLANAGYNAHLHHLQLCGKSVLEHERKAAEDRVRSTPDVAKALDRRDRRRRSKKSPAQLDREIAHALRRR